MPHANLGVGDGGSEQAQCVSTRIDQKTALAAIQHQGIVHVVDTTARTSLHRGNWKSCKLVSKAA